MAKIQNASECVAWSIGNLAATQNVKIDRAKLDNFLRAKLKLKEGVGIDERRALMELKKVGVVKSFKMVEFADLNLYSETPLLVWRRVFKGVKFKKRNGTTLYDVSTATLSKTTHACISTSLNKREVYIYDTGFTEESKKQKYRVQRIDERLVFLRFYFVKFNKNVKSWMADVI